jgi:ABC-type lipoprotein release transport system permease subunit
MAGREDRPNGTYGGHEAVSTPLIGRYAVRTLGRNVRRTLLSVVGIGIGVAIAIFMTAFMKGSTLMRVRAIAESGFGHVMVTHSDWDVTRDNELRLTDWEAELAAVRAMPEVKVAAPHTRTTALLAFGTRVAGVEMLGVDPIAETESSRLVRGVSEGRYLEEGDTDVAVVGSTIVERLEVELDDDLLVTVVDAEGEMEYAMLRIVGIIDTGSRDMDATICHVMLEDVERLTRLPGAGEISITLHEPLKMDSTVPLLKEVVSPSDDVLTWIQVVPAQGGDYQSDKGFMNLLSGTVVVVVILGIAGAQLTAILERRREFAVLIALGMKSSQVVRLILFEAVALAVMGAVAGLLLAWWPVHYTATVGIDFGAVMGDDLAVYGVLFDPVMYSIPGSWVFGHAFVIALVSTLIAGIYPAFFALRTDPTSALSLREA